MSKRDEKEKAKETLNKALVAYEEARDKAYKIYFATLDKIESEYE